MTSLSSLVFRTNVKEMADHWTQDASHIKPSVGVIAGGALPGAFAVTGNALVGGFDAGGAAAVDTFNPLESATTYRVAGGLAVLTAIFAAAFTFATGGGPFEYGRDVVYGGFAFGGGLTASALLHGASAAIDGGWQGVRIGYAQTKMMGQKVKEAFRNSDG